MAYPTTSQLNMAQIAEELLAYHEREDTFAQSIAQRQSKSTFVFYEGPPSANGPPGIHHVLTRTLKDLFCRYKTMQGYHVPRKAGWDTHGLPVELQVEKELGITKDDIGKKISIADYNEKCRAAVMRFEGEWEQLTRRIGYWTDMEKPYRTCDRPYISKLWNLLQQLYNKGLLYKGHTIQPYSPAAGTGLSTHELNQPGCYKEVKDTSIVAQFQLKEEAGTYLLAWTTTPWTLPANSALAVCAQVDYVQLRTFNRYTQKPIQVILAADAVERYFDAAQQDAPLLPPVAPDSPLPWQQLAQYKGRDLIGKQYQQLMPYVQPATPAFSIVAGDFVTTKEGTGIVHIAPTFGSDDYRLAQQQGIPSITVPDSEGKALPIVDEQGRFVAAITDYAGCYVKEAYRPTEAAQKSKLSTDLRIVIQLKKENKAFLVSSYTHSYPHCWRTDKPILYYPLASWFIKTTACKAQLLALNKTINWQPKSTGTGRFGAWLENLVDWNLSRSRFWGTPLPIWRTEDGKEECCIGSLQELREAVKASVKAGFMEGPLAEDIDLHRPYVEDIILVSPQGHKMYREPDLIDVWFDSGAMPYAQDEQEDPTHIDPGVHFPADFIAEGVDQTRGWFFTLHALSVLLYDRVAYKNVLSTGLVLAKNGLKMSKRLGNTIAPLPLLDAHGPDVVRWYMVGNASPWDNLKFDPQELVETKKRFFSTLHNTYTFFALYANLDNFSPTSDYSNLAHCTLSDRWILSKLQELITEVTQNLDSYNPTPAVRAITRFVVDDMSNWYVRLNRKRFWRSGSDVDKTNAYQTLHTVLQTVARLAAPFAPFYMDKLYQDLQASSTPSSVHLADFPQVTKAYRSEQLEREMGWAQQLTSAVHAMRKRQQLRVRQPLSQLIICGSSAAEQQEITSLQVLLLQEVNLKAVSYQDDAEALLTRTAKPNLQVLGKKYGKLLKALIPQIQALSSDQLATLQQEGKHTLQLEGQAFTLVPEDLLLTTTPKPGWDLTTVQALTLALDLTLTPDLIGEGLARELVNRVQHARKEAGFAVEDKITLELATPSAQLRSALALHRSCIMEETQALKLSWHNSLSEGCQLQLSDTETLTMQLARV
jgi:isoleucyl-tRNA synthetase